MRRIDLENMAIAFLIALCIMIVVYLLGLLVWVVGIKALLFIMTFILIWAGIYIYMENVDK